MYKNILNEAEKAEEVKCIRLNSRGEVHAEKSDVLRIKGLDATAVIFYDSDGNLIDKVPVHEQAR